jgi:hypothetical protein
MRDLRKTGAVELRVSSLEYRGDRVAPESIQPRLGASGVRAQWFWAKRDPPSRFSLGNTAACRPGRMAV